MSSYSCYTAFFSRDSYPCLRPLFMDFYHFYFKAFVNGFLYFCKNCFKGCLSFVKALFKEFLSFVWSFLKGFRSLVKAFFHGVPIFLFQAFLRDSYPFSRPVVRSSHLLFKAFLRYAHPILRTFCLRDSYSCLRPF